MAWKIGAKVKAVKTTSFEGKVIWYSSWTLFRSVNTLAECLPGVWQFFWGRGAHGSLVLGSRSKGILPVQVRVHHLRYSEGKGNCLPAGRNCCLNQGDLPFDGALSFREEACGRGSTLQTASKAGKMDAMGIMLIITAWFTLLIVSRPIWMTTRRIELLHDRSTFAVFFKTKWITSRGSNSFITSQLSQCYSELYR